MVRGRAIEDHTGDERARVAIERDGVRILNLSMEDADTLRNDRRVDARIRAVLTQLTLGQADA